MAINNIINLQTENFSPTGNWEFSGDFGVSSSTSINLVSSAGVVHLEALGGHTGISMNGDQINLDAVNGLNLFCSAGSVSLGSDLGVTITANTLMSIVTDDFQVSANGITGSISLSAQNTLALTATSYIFNTMPSGTSSNVVFYDNLTGALTYDVATIFSPAASYTITGDWLFTGDCNINSPASFLTINSQWYTVTAGLIQFTASPNLYFSTGPGGVLWQWSGPNCINNIPGDCYFTIGGNTFFNATNISYGSLATQASVASPPTISLPVGFNYVIMDSTTGQLYRMT